jgi:predicted nucleic acid-binding protein
MLYLDTSAFLKLFILEMGSQEVQDLLFSQHDPLPLWEIQEMELRNALRLKVFWGDITQKDSDRQVELLLDRKRRGQYVYPRVERASLFYRVGQLTDLSVQSGCRTMDILHVACALEIEADLFVSYDVRQTKLAVQLGLKTFGVSSENT